MYDFGRGLTVGFMLDLDPGVAVIAEEGSGGLCKVPYFIDVQDGVAVLDRQGEFGRAPRPINERSRGVWSQ